MMYRQGDVAMLADGPATTRDDAPRPVVLVRGVSTGHAHTLTRAWRVSADVVIAAEGCELVHPEHATIAIPAGAYRVRRQIEGVDTMVED